MTFENGNSYNLKDPDLQYFITNTKFDRETDKKIIIYSFLNDMKYNITYGDKNQSDIILIKISINNAISNWEVVPSSSHMIQTN